MQTISTLKKDMEFNKGLSSLIEVLKNIAVSQYRALEKKLHTYDQFSEGVESFFEFIDLEKMQHRFLVPAQQKMAVIAVTSDSGLLGGLNMQVVSQAARELEKIPGEMFILGERGKMYAKEFGLRFTAFSGVKDESRLTQALTLRDFVMARILKNEFDYLKIVYPHPLSFTVQKVQVISVLPFLQKKENVVQSSHGAVDILLESNLEDMLEYVIFLWLGQKLYDVFGLSRLAEFAARYVHLEESLQKLKTMDTKLRLQYFRVRHELIDRNMRELFSARLLYTN